MSVKKEEKQVFKPKNLVKINNNLLVTNMHDKTKRFSRLIVLVALKRACWLVGVRYLSSRPHTAYLELVYLVTALVPSETACLASSPGRRSLTEVWISREVMVDLLL